MREMTVTEFLKLRRQKTVPVLMGSSFLMPALAALMFGYLGRTDVAPGEFYRWSAFGFPFFIILPMVLGIMSMILSYGEQKNGITRQLWMVPVGKTGYLAAKFFLILLCSAGFMLLTALASWIFSVLPGFVPFSLENLWYLITKCAQIGVLTAFAMVPVVAFVSVQKGYFLSFCVLFLYVFSGFFLMGGEVYLHPICAAAAVVMRDGDIPGVMGVGRESVCAAVVCIAGWDLAAFAAARCCLGRR